MKLRKSSFSEEMLQAEDGMKDTNTEIMKFWNSGQNKNTRDSIKPVIRFQKPVVSG